MSCIETGVKQACRDVARSYARLGPPMELNIYPRMPQRKDFRIGILGSGFIVNECHLTAYRKAGFNPVAIASRNREHAAEVATRHHLSTVYSSYRELLADPKIEVLDLAVT